MTDTLDPRDDGLMTIGQFSSLARISVRMLRHYDEHGVLVPAHVDAATGYRRYRGSQLETALAIRRLRDVGFGVSAISTLLAARGTPAFAQALTLQRRVLADDLRAARQRLALLDRLVDDLRGPDVSITIDITTHPAATLVALRDVIPNYQSEGLLWERFLPEVEAQGLRPLGGGSTNHDEGFKESDVDTSVWIVVPAGTRVRPPLTVAERPEQRVMAATLTGPLDGISEAVDRLSRRLADDGIAPTGPLSVRYLTDHDVTPPQDSVTEVSFPIG